MSYPKITDKEATPGHIKALLDKGKYIYIPTFPDGEQPVFKDREKGEYIYSPNPQGDESSFLRYPATMEGLTQLAFFLLFSGCDYL